MHTIISLSVLGLTFCLLPLEQNTYFTSRPHKNAQNILNELTIITASHLFQIGLQVHPLAEDVHQEVLTLVLGIACTAQKDQRFSLHRNIGNNLLCTVAYVSTI